MKKRKVMIITADHVGTEHQATANTLAEQLQSRGYLTRQVKISTLLGKLGRKMAAGYVPFTRRHPWLGKMLFGFTQTATRFTHWAVYCLAHKALLTEIKFYKPDLIISLHGNFTKVVSKVLRQADLKIPFMIDVLDLVNPPQVWYDPDATLTWVPTDAVKEQGEWAGLDAKHLAVVGFPADGRIVVPTAPKTVASPLPILMVDPAISVGNGVDMVREVAEIPDTQLTVICGQNERLYKKLLALQQNGALSGVMLYGAVDNWQDFLANSQILMTQSRPQYLVAGSRSGTAVVVTGHLPWGEAENYQYVTQNGFGFNCENPAQIKEQLTEFINSHQLEQCLARTLFADNNDSIKLIADQIDQYLGNTDATKKVVK